MQTHGRGTAPFESSKTPPLDLHTHEQPFLADNIDVLGPVVQGRHLETGPPETSHQNLGFVFGNVSVQAKNDVGAL